MKDELKTRDELWKLLDEKYAARDAKYQEAAGIRGELNYALNTLGMEIRFIKQKLATLPPRPPLKLEGEKLPHPVPMVSG